MQELRDKLRVLHAALCEASEVRFAEAAAAALEMPDLGLAAYLRSSELWGSQGSLCDRAFQSCDANLRKRGTKAIIALGKQQLAWGRRDGIEMLHERTGTWTNALTDWLREGVI